MDEFEKRLQEFKEHFGDLIDDETLRLLTAYSFGHMPVTKISELANKKGKVVIEGVIEKVLGVREFIKNNGAGLVANAILKDENARVRVVFWNDSAELIKNGDIVEGCRVRLRGFVKRRDEIEISVNDPSDVEILEDSRKTLRGIVLGSNGTKLVLKHGNSARVCTLKCNCNLKRGDVVEIKGYGEGEFVITDVRVLGSVEVDTSNLFTPISKIVPLRNVNIKGRVSGLNGVRLVKGKDLAEIFVSDESDRVRVLLWCDHAKLYRKLDIGDEIEIYNAYPKIGWDGEIEVHCGWNTVIMKV
jgi:replication factor A1